MHVAMHIGGGSWRALEFKDAGYRRDAEERKEGQLLDMLARARPWVRGHDDDEKELRARGVGQGTLASEQSGSARGRAPSCPLS